MLEKKPTDRIKEGFQKFFGKRDGVKVMKATSPKPLKKK